MESTIEVRTHGGLMMIIIGLLMFLVPVGYLFATGWSGKKNG
jgi:flagellar basal body-associated protein FliL